MTEEALLEERTDDAITKDFRVFQRKRGHRYSIDDVLTAQVAAEACPQATRVLDLGSGIGSVAIMLAWKFPNALFTTIEAQEISYAMQRENLDRNALTARVRPLQGDFRDLEVQAHAALGGPFELITGTPPYFSPQSALASSDTQRAHARLEMRGGVEDYLACARALATPATHIVVCADALKPERVLGTARSLGLEAKASLVVHPREGKAPLFTVWTLGLRQTADEGAKDLPSPTPTPWIARTADGQRSPAQHQLRAFFGLSIHESSSPRGAST